MLDDTPLLSSQIIPLTKYQTDSLIAALKPYGREVLLSRREFLRQRPDCIYFLLDGNLMASLSKEKFAIDYAFRYMPIGLVELTHPEIKINYRALSVVRLIRVPATVLDSLYERGNMEIFRILMILKSSVLSALLNAYEERCTHSAYETIQLLVERYLREPEQLEGLASYILRRTHFSRGYVFGVLAKLRKKGVLDMVKGRLVAINSKFPQQL